MPANPKSTFKPLSAKSQQLFLIKPKVILRLIRSSRRLLPPVAGAEVPWADLMVATAMYWRGVSSIDVVTAFGISERDFLGNWLETVIRRRSEFTVEMHVYRWEAMGRQADSKASARADRIICTDCLSLMQITFPTTIDSVDEAFVFLSQVLIFLRDQRIRESYFEPGMKIEENLPRLQRCFREAVARARASAEREHDPALLWPEGILSL
jgi:hypothetical protein